MQEVREGEEDNDSVEEFAVWLSAEKMREKNKARYTSAGKDKLTSSRHEGESEVRDETVQTDSMIAHPGAQFMVYSIRVS